MRKVLALCALTLALLLPDPAPAQVAWSTGVVGFQLRNAGAIRFGAPSWSTTRHLDRTSLVAALDPTAVFDQAQDADVLEPASFITIPGIDTVATNVSDNTFSGLPPTIRVRTTVYGWRNETYVIFRYTVTNDSSVTLPLYLGTAVIPRVAGTYGLETCQWNATRQVAYYYRGAEAVYVGFKYLEGTPASFHVRDWNAYSPDPSSDLAPDSVRYAMTAPAGFDGPLTGGPDGTIFHFNAGLRNIAPGASVTISYALVFAPTLAAMLDEADSAQARFDAFVPPEVHDIGIVKLREVTGGSPPEGAPVTLEAAVQNNGAFLENSYQIGWEIDGVLQSPVANTEPLTIGDRDTITLTWPAPPTGLHRIRAWTILGTDSTRSNDSSGVVGVFRAPPYTVFEERFNGTFPPAGWTTVNADGGGTTGPWAQGATSRFTAAEGPENGFAGDAYTTANGLYIDDYLITPNTGTAPDPTGADSLVFYVRSYADTLYRDSLEIRLSTSTPDTAAFTAVLGYIEVPKSGWTRFAYLLPQAASRYVAFRYLMYDGGASGTNSVYIGLDLVHVVRHGGTTATVQVPLGTGWNLVSIPVSTTADSMRQVFPQSLLDYGFAFSGAGGYVQSPRLEGGKGYWAKIGTPHTQTVSGNARNSVTIPVTQGWNMVGALSALIDTSAAYVSTAPPGLRSTVFFRYKPLPAPGYAVATELVPGSGYWVKMSGPGTMTLSFSAPPERAAAGEAPAGLHRLTVRDARGHAQTLSFGSTTTVGSAAEMFELPPPAPEEALDVRFADGRMLWTAADGDRGAAMPLIIRSAVYPLTVTWTMAPGAGAFSLVRTGGPEAAVTLAGDGEVILPRPDGGLLLRSGGGGDVPAVFALAQNYPNPFNPSTTVTVDLPEAARVLLEVFDLLGRKVAALADGPYAAGRYGFTWDGSSVTGGQAAGGTYFLRLTAAAPGTSFTATRKMLLVK